jgi:hypothetical protein
MNMASSNHAIQYQYTWKRTQYWYRGRVRYLSAVS